MRKTKLFVLILFSLLATVYGQSREVELTIYNNFTLVKEIRNMNFTKSGEYYFDKVSNRIISNSLQFNPLNNRKNIQLLEQIFNYNIVNHSKLIENCVGKKIEIIKGEKKYSGKLLSFLDNVIVLECDKEIKILKWSEDIFINLKKEHPKYISQPQIVWSIVVKKPVKTPVEITYLTRGISWDVNYSGMYDEEKSELSLNSWVSLKNHTSTEFPKAKINLVAGDVNIENSDDSYSKSRNVRGGRAKARTSSFKEQNFSEYHLYSINKKTAIKANQQKQISFISAEKVKVNKIFQYSSQTDPSNVKSILKFNNSKKNNLGKSLPTGLFRVFQQVNNSPRFIGEKTIQATPIGADVTLELGNAFDVKGSRKLINKEKPNKIFSTEEYEIEITNHKKNKTVEVEVIEKIYAPDWKIVNINCEYKKIDFQTIKFYVKLPSKSKKKIVYKVKKIWKAE